AYGAYKTDHYKRRHAKAGGTLPELRKPRPMPRQRSEKIMMPAGSQRYLSAGGAHLGHPLVELPSQMRNDAQLALDQHELRAMVHLMLLRAKQPLESGLRHFSVGLGHPLRQEFRGHRLEPRRKPLSHGSQHLQAFRHPPAL